MKNLYKHLTCITMKHDRILLSILQRKLHLAAIEYCSEHCKQILFPSSRFCIEYLIYFSFFHVCFFILLLTVNWWQHQSSCFLDSLSLSNSWWLFKSPSVFLGKSNKAEGVTGMFCLFFIDCISLIYAIFISLYVTFMCMHMYCHYIYKYLCTHI